MNTPIADPRLKLLVQAFEDLRPQTLPALLDLYAEQAHFADPFNDVTGRDRIERIFRHMFDALSEPRFTVEQALVQGDAAFLVWTFGFRWRPGGSVQAFSGASHLQFAPDGRVLTHRDYWDAAHDWYARFPLLGPLMRWCRRRFSTPQ